MNICLAFANIGYNLLTLALSKWVKYFEKRTLYSTNPSHFYEDSLILWNYSQSRWLSRRKKPRGVTLEDNVVLGVYTWTQPSYSECLHLDPAHLGNLHWVFTFGPSPVAATPPTISPVQQISSQCIRKSRWVFTSGPSPVAAFSPS